MKKNILPAVDFVSFQIGDFRQAKQSFFLYVGIYEGGILPFVVGKNIKAAFMFLEINKPRQFW